MSLNNEERRTLVRLQIEKADYNCTYNATEKDIAPKIEPTRQLTEKN